MQHTQKGGFQDAGRKAARNVTLALFVVIELA